MPDLPTSGTVHVQLAREHVHVTRSVRVMDLLQEAWRAAEVEKARSVFLEQEKRLRKELSEEKDREMKVQAHLLSRLRPP